jgi:aryl-alcohol dehydrogenase-like predicted oxidoreductase
MSTKPNPDLYDLPFITDGYKGMPYLHLGRSGLRVSKVGLGTWKIGYPETGDGSRVDEKTAFQLFDRAVEIGVTFWDTANRYNSSSGNSERVIGKWLAQNPDQRRNLVIATKMFGCMDGSTPNHCRLGRGAIKDAVSASLDRMQTDHVELLYFHGYDPLTPVEESLDAVGDLISQDVVRYLGLSNFTRDQLRIYLEMERCGYPRILCVQNGYNLLEGARFPEEDVLEFCAQNGIDLVAWSPLGAGLLTDRYLDPDKVGKGDRLVDENTLDKKLTPENKERLQRLHKLSQSWGISISQISLAYMLSLPGMGPVIPSATKLEHLEANAKAGTIELDPQQRLEIAQALTSP